MIVCHCRVIHDDDVRAAMDAGAGSLGAVCRATGAGSDCGCCVRAIKDLVCEYGSRSGFAYNGLLTLALEVDDETGQLAHSGAA